MRFALLAVIATPLALAAPATQAQDTSAPAATAPETTPPDTALPDKVTSPTSHTGTVNAVAFDPVPAGATVEVDPLDDSDESLMLKKEFQRLLRDKGYQVGDKAKLVLSFETVELRGAWTGGGDNRWLELYNAQNHTGTDAPAVQLNLYKSDKGGLINRLGNQKPEGTHQVSSSKLRLDATLDDSSNGKRVWQGWSVIELGASDDVSRHKSMVPPLVDAFGRTVRQQTFPIP